MITRPQIKLIHSLRSAMKMSEEYYRAMLGGYNVHSSMNLSHESATDLINKMTSMAVAAGVWTQKQPAAGPKAQPFDDLGTRPGMATPAQLRKICAMWGDVTRAQGTQDRRKALNSFLGHHFGITFIQWLPIESVGKVIAAIESMINTKQKQENKHETGISNVGI